MKVIDTWRAHYWYSVPCARARIEEIVRRIGEAKYVLDAGCNEGFLSMALKEAGCDVTSIDNDPAMIVKAKETFGIDALQADVNNLPFADGLFDLVVGGEVLEHLDNPGKGLSELFRVSKGRVILSMPIGEYWLGCPDHKWQIDTAVIEHDEGIVNRLIKKIIVVEFNKRP
jgi:2-polyprenyl-3-methyl-5-hydroxy-6-metoxy-1,4-benzoquinol methylase